MDPQQKIWSGIEMIQAYGQRRPGSANMRGIAADLVYDSLKDSRLYD
jgi:hypothetical protein